MFAFCVHFIYSVRTLYMAYLPSIYPYIKTLLPLKAFFPSNFFFQYHHRTHNLWKQTIIFFRNIPNFPGDKLTFYLKNPYIPDKKDRAKCIRMYPYNILHFICQTKSHRIFMTVTEIRDIWMEWIEYFPSYTCKCKSMYIHAYIYV